MCIHSIVCNRRTFIRGLWFKHTVPHLSSIQCSRRSLEIDPKNWRSCSMAPCQPVTEWVFCLFFFASCFLCLVFFGIFRLDPTIFGETNIKKYQLCITGRQGLKEHVRQIFASLFQKRRGQLVFSEVKMPNNTAFPRDYLSASIASTFGRKYDLILVLRSEFCLNISRECFSRHALGHLEAIRPEKIWGGGERFLPTERLAINDLLAGLCTCSWSGRQIAAGTSPITGVHSK